MKLLSKNQVLMLHTCLIKATGGSNGIRDGLVKNHSMVDGNKRLGIHVMLVFLALNGYELSYGQQELSDTILAMASGELSAKDMIEWIIEHQK